MNRILAGVGLFGGLFWIVIAFFPPQCMPVTESSEVFCNRLWTPGLLGMLLGFSGIFVARLPVLTRNMRASFTIFLVGFTMMALGNFIEYWILYRLPHQGPNGWIRSLAWMTLLLGLLAVQVSSAIVGIFGFKSGNLPRWLSALFLLLLPATIVTGFAGSHWVGIPMGILSLAAGAWGVLFLPRGENDRNRNHLL